MEKLVVFPLNNDTEILIKGLKENKLYQVVAVSSYIEDRSRLELLQKKSSIYCSTEFEECLTRADAIVFSENTILYTVYIAYEPDIILLNQEEEIFESSKASDIDMYIVRKNNMYELYAEDRIGITYNIEDIYELVCQYFA